MSPIYSFDIFDTVLTRLVIKPSHIFSICGDRANQYGWLQISAAVYERERIKAEERSRQFCEGGEVQLQEIYRELANTLEIDVVTQQKLQELELVVETEYLVTVPEIVSKIEQIRKSGANIIFISDMYLPSEFLRARLQQFGIWGDRDRLYVSSEYRKSKGKGDLFKYVLQDLQIAASDLIHTGNNLHADIKRPQSLGIRTVYFEQANPNRYETILEKFSPYTEGISSHLASISRYSRLHITALDPKQQILGDIAVSVAAPILSAYVIWILQQAKAQKLARIYFLARDGEILLQIAQKLAPQIYPEVELRYLYVSRQALRIPGLTKINQGFWDWMFDNTDFLSIESLLKRMCLSTEVAAPILSAVGYPLSTWQRNLSQEERKTLRDQLEQNQVLMAALLQVAEQKRQVLKSYLQQEKMLDGQTFGLVDVGWRGSLQISLENVFALFGTQMPVGFYFAIAKPSGGIQHQGKVLAYFFDLIENFGMRSKIDDRYVSAMEVFCAGCQGTTLDYQLQADGSVIPLLKHEHNQPALDWGLPFFQSSVLHYVQHLIERSPNTPIFNTSPKLWREALDQVFLSFTKDITLEEAQAFVDCPFFDDPNELYHFYWAMPLQLKDILKYALKKSDTMNVHRNAWWEASFQVSPPWLKAIIPIVTAPRRVLKRFKKSLRSSP
jgi:predicted HAD superfamily hydrolase